MSESEFDPRPYASVLDDREDHAPGDEPVEDTGHWVLNSNIGLGFSVILTLAAFALANSQIMYAPAIPVALIVLAIAQMGVHLVFFLHVTTGPDNTNNVLALAFGLLVVFLVVLGSMWIMHHIAGNMTPMSRMADVPF
jgi:cytochrome o ubiquinol oxidase operon protein cyoD